MAIKHAVILAVVLVSGEFAVGAMCQSSPASAPAVPHTKILAIPIPPVTKQPATQDTKAPWTLVVPMSSRARCLEALNKVSAPASDHARCIPSSDLEQPKK